MVSWRLLFCYYLVVYPWNCEHDVIKVGAVKMLTHRYSIEFEMRAVVASLKIQSGSNKALGRLHYHEDYGHSFHVSEAELVTSNTEKRGHDHG